MAFLDTLAIGFAAADATVCHHGVLMEAECDGCFAEVEELEAEGLL